MYLLLLRVYEVQEVRQGKGDEDHVKVGKGEAGALVEELRPREAFRPLPTRVIARLIDLSVRTLTLLE